MGGKFSERRLAENEVLFRKSNKKIAKGFTELKSVALEEGQDQWVKEADEPLPFYCECSDKNCHKRVELRPSEYENIHKNIRQFVILPGHNIPEIERIVSSSEKCLVVEKNFTPPTPSN